MKRQIKAVLFGGVAIAALAATTLPAAAQETSSAIRGVVVSQTGDHLAGVKVQIVHVPTGTVKEFTTNADGTFFARGLKVGGPYIVKLADGTQYKANSISDLNLVLGQAANVTLVAASHSAGMEEIEVTAQRGSFMIKTGAASEYGKADISNMNSTDRDLKSVLRMDSKVWIDPANSDALSIAGTNNRYNSLTIDGVRQSDDFGLNNNGYPTQRSPISLDAIEQISVQTAPFDVTYGHFQGGNINVVTKSGTNEFHGGAFLDYSNDGMVGSSSKDDTDLQFNFTEKNYGAYLGGPIVKDKLFFFGSYEKYDSTKPFEYGASDSNAPNKIIGVTQSDLDRVESIAKSVYNYDPQGFSADNLKETDRKILFKIDWNIADGQRFSATYQNVDGNNINPQNTYYNNAGMLGDWYNKNDKMQTYSFQLFSDWTDKLSSELKVGIKNVHTIQQSIGGTDFALMKIQTADGGNIFIGPDFYRHANDLKDDSLTVKAKVDYSTGDHVFTAGYELEHLKVFNLFVPGSAGEYTFNSIDDFENQNAASLYYSNAYTNDANDAAANFTFNVHTLYAQDRWTPTDKMTVFAGVRYERYQTSQAPRLNTSFVDRNGFANTENLDGKSILLPRLGFNYVADERTTVRGGFGLFSGGTPNVWLSNAYSNDGTIISSVYLTGLTGVDGYNLPAAATGALVPGNGNVNATDPNFKIPSTWKFNIAVDHDFDLSSIGLGDQWHVTAEAIFSKVKNAVIWRELRRQVVGQAPDGRPIYDIPSGHDLLLTNTDQGSSQIYSIDVDKQWQSDAGDFAIRFGYTHTNAKDVNPGQSSTADSNYGKVPTTDRNNLALAHSDFEIKHNFTANFNWQKKFWGDNATSVNLFMLSRSGHNFSYTFDDPGSRSQGIFGGSYDYWKRDTQLFYVPTGADDPNVDMSGIDANALMQFVHDQGLDKYKGKVAPRNVGRSPWVTRLDMRISQELPIPSLKGHKVILHMDIDNLTNLLNNNWGRFEQVSFPYNSNVVRATINDAGQYVYTNFNGSVYSRFYQLPSLWKIKVGIKYTF
ncbi:TonB-dependent receptor [Kordiimonas marina]|uniref:TonB-dependent receptor n=1 Tax=Kordiimonas marina TaxID=2872312 RepID=UPI001FF157A2|nr:TonB-dependent receptor [Kordiimonas marina]MCJ9427681.1 TonB-dependent receptor [Kordiimonas marina]